MDMLRPVLVPIHRAGWKFIAGFVVVTALLFLFVANWLGWLGVVACLWCVYFFRDPPRHAPVRPGLILSPGDGVIQLIEPAVPPPELDMGTDALTRISIFLNIFDVHVNRVPASGRVVKLAYRPGKFFNAALDKASTDNERQAVRLRLDEGGEGPGREAGAGREIAFVQIAGLVARRIVCDLRAEQQVLAGERFGLIRFGSRCDVYLPDGVAPLVAVGQRAVGGETVLADLHNSEPARRAEER